jgi:hypothetical protein
MIFLKMIDCNEIDGCARMQLDAVPTVLVIYTMVQAKRSIMQEW